MTEQHDPTAPHVAHPDVIECDDGEHFIDLREGWSHYGWVMRRHAGDGCLISVRPATRQELTAAVWKRMANRLPVIEYGRTPGRFA